MDKKQNLEKEWNSLYPKLFYLFLKKRCILLPYVDNCRKIKSSVSTPFDELLTLHGSIIRVLDIYPYNSIASAFVWDVTPQGFEFWKNAALGFNNFLIGKRSEFFKEH